jgi:glycosyltransferase 2 family protein
MQQIWSYFSLSWKRWKFLLSPLLLVAIFAFLGQTLYRHWYEAQNIRVTGTGWACLAIATGVTLLAHAWTGCVWGWILADLGQRVSPVWASQAYLKTNIAKYLPSNLLHLYGRAVTAKQEGIPIGLATLSVLLDTLLMVAAGLLLGIYCIPREGLWLLLAITVLVSILGFIHPAILNPVLRKLSQSKSLTTALSYRPLPAKKRLIRHYPVGPLLGEIAFVLLRGLGFVLTVFALTPITPAIVPLLLSTFSIGWVLGFVTPGAPGGLGVFELTVSTLLSHSGLFASEQNFPIAIAISAVAIHRVINTLAEALGAILAWADERWPLKLG